MNRALLTVTVILALSTFAAMARADMPRPKAPLWKPIRDSVYLQEVEGRVLTKFPLLAAAVLDNVLYVGGKNGVQRLDGEKLAPAGGPGGAVLRLKALNGSLYAIGERGLWRMSAGAWKKLSDDAFADACVHLGSVVVAGAQTLYRVDGDTLVALNKAPCPFPILGVASYAETLYVRNPQDVAFLEKGAFNYDDVKDWGHLPLGSSTRDILSLGSRLIVPTDRGLGVLRGMSWYDITGKDGLCYEDTTCVAPGFAGDDCWIGTTKGAIRNVDGEYQYFGYERWIPNEKVNAIACGNRVAYIATDLGLGIIRYEPFTLQKKAAWYERWIDEWGMRRNGFLSTLDWNEKTHQWERFISDNDGGWLAHLLNGYCFKYAVTRDPAVREQAVEAFRSLCWCEIVSGIRGFPARAVATVSEPSILAATGSAGLPSQWNLTPDKKFLWKGDTSSDEIDSHIQATMIFYELVARGKEKEAAREHIHRIVSHIIDNGWVLRDVSGKPTRWGRWDPQFLQTPAGASEAPLNSMEAISMCTAAYALTRDAKFLRARKQLIDWGYLDPILREKVVFPVATHFDDRLAFLVFHPLLTYEKDPQLRSLFRRSLERTWEVKRLENMVWFDYIYGGVTGNEIDSERGLKNLQIWPLDCHAYAYHNSHRADLQVPAGYKNYIGDTKCMTTREIGIQRWDGNFMELDRGGPGPGPDTPNAVEIEAERARHSSIADPAGYLDAYWMARYYGMILPPDTHDSTLLTVEHRGLHLGAKPYDGPPRPDVGF